MGYHLLWCTHKSHMHQPMKIHGYKLPSLLKQVYETDPCIYMIHPKSKPNLNLLPPIYPPTLFVISSQNPWKISLIWFWLNPPNYHLVSNFSIIFKPHHPSWPLDHTKSTQYQINYHMGRDACKLRHPLIYFHVYLIAAGEMILLGRLKSTIEDG